MRALWNRLLLAAVALLCLAPAVFAQGATTSTLTGLAIDSAGGVIPGASVSVKSNATGSTFETVTNAEGAFSVPALNAGIYTVTVSLVGFKTAVLGNVQLLPGRPTEVKAVLDVGSLSETVVVEGASPVVNTTTATITSTLDVDQINKIPLPTRNALNAVAFLPGVDTAGVNRDATFNGLPQSFINITLDGVSNNDNFNKATDGFFAMVTPRQDAVEAVAVTSAVGGADVGGHGAVAVAFVTRSGTNRFTGSAYEYHRNPRLNTNYWFNVRNGVPKNDVRLNQFGVRQGGPIVIPGLYDGHNKAFFFFNYEELRLPNNFSRTRNVLTPLAQSGVFSYLRGTALERVNLLELAGRLGFPTSLDPLTQRIQGYINSATGTTGVLNATNDPNLFDYVWQSPGDQIERQPLLRIDYNLGNNHRINGVYNWQVVRRQPDHLNSADARFPTSLNSRTYISYRPLSAGALRSTLRSNIVNELRGGIKWGPGSFGQVESNGPPTYTDTDMLAVDIVASNANADGLNLTNWYVENSPTARSAWSWNIDDTLTWQRGRHALSFGTSLFFGNVWEDGQQMVPGIRLGINTADAANAMFTTANFPGASAAVLTDARELYAFLIGRVDQVNGQAALSADTGTYEFLGKRRRAGRMNEYSVFLQDQWRLTPTLTLNGGLRWDLQMPFTPVNDILTQGTLADACGVSGFTPDGTCRFFDPQASGGKVPDFQLFSKGSQNYKTDWNNIAPNISVAWRPNAQDGWLRRLLGDPDQATLRGGFSIAYDRQGFQRFTEQYGSNPGSTLPLSRTVENGLLPPGTMLRDRDQLYPQSFPETPSYPIAMRANRADDVSIFHPDIQVASARTWMIGFQRALSRNMAIEARYVGTRGVNQWTEENWNDIEDGVPNINILENGFFDEFRLAMANLQANNASGDPSRVGSFRYVGPGSGTSPLPIYLAHLNGSRDIANPNAYSGANWTNATLAGRLTRANPRPYEAAQDLINNATRRTAGLGVGISPTFFIVNPNADDVYVWMSRAFSDYHALQLELRRRLSRGLQVNASYQYAHESGSENLGIRYGRVMSPSDQQVRHAIKTQWDWSIPVGRGRRYGATLPRALDYILGGWEFSGAGRHQARLEDFGNVRLVGMDVDELTSMYKVRFETDSTGVRRAYMLPADVILNTRRAYNVSTSSVSGYSELGVPEGKYIAPANSADCIQLKAGDCAPRRVLVRAPFFTRFDIALNKRFPIQGRVNFELRFDLLNVFDNVNFTPTSNPGTGATIFEVTAGYTDLSNTFDPGGRLGQLVFRLNW